jgi:hypothetical protein
MDCNIDLFQEGTFCAMTGSEGRHALVVLSHTLINQFNMVEIVFRKEKKFFHLTIAFTTTGLLKLHLQS